MSDEGRTDVYQVTVLNQDTGERFSTTTQTGKGSKEVEEVTADVLKKWKDNETEVVVEKRD